MQVMHRAPKRYCPRCGCDRVAHSRHRGAIEEQVLRTIRLDAYRCCDCGKRFYGRSGSSRSDSPQAAWNVTSSRRGNSGGTV